MSQSAQKLETMKWVKIIEYRCCFSTIISPREENLWQLFIFKKNNILIKGPLSL